MTVAEQITADLLVFMLTDPVLSNIYAIFPNVKNFC